MVFKNGPAMGIKAIGRSDKLLIPAVAQLYSAEMQPTSSCRAEVNYHRLFLYRFSISISVFRFYNFTSSPVMNLETKQPVVFLLYV